MSNTRGQKRLRVFVRDVTMSKMLSKFCLALLSFARQRILTYVGHGAACKLNIFV